MRKFLKKLFKVIGISVLAGLVVVMISLVALNIIWGRQVKAELAKIKAKGEPTSMADMAKPAIPDSENGALIYIEIGKRLSTDDARKDMDTLREFTSRQIREKNPKLWDESRVIISKYEHVITEIELAAAKPQCRFPADWWKQGADAIPWEYHSRFRKMATLLRADALLNAKDGRMDECCRSIRLGVQLVNGPSDERTLTSYIGSIAVLHIAHASLQDSLKYGGFDEHQARQLYDVLSGLDLMEGHRKALLGERVSLLYDLPRIGGARIIEMTRLQGWNSIADDLLGRNRKPTDQVLGLVYDTAERNGDALVWLRFMDRQIAGLQLSYKRAVSQGLLDDEPHFAFYAVMSNMLAGVEVRAYDSRFRAMSRIAGDQILLALIAHKDRYKAYPANLGELRAKLGWKIPEDPFSGKDFIYRRQEKGFIVYSMGRNMKDDGGKESPNSDPDRYDMVWRVDH